ncbi:Stk1 family PASTA domain-containing Ser/Thr kinase [Alteribacillus iranensis]|uniref:Serine/threonine-protein kinase PrkC n=1 Tax=Alteribacillus iranensis TaxID=930128 RepID=A0A1I2A871_9BACI|nr:Stk1 family PASTA domain-containing Ser/Thr kinase [Alteribacillus iranensis]SFE40016.1 serine/threonine protein kinase [Alteribacillus iranensis]
MSELIGKRISQRYEIQDMIGGGGMAHVYKGIDLILERPVAVKVLQPQYNTDEEFIRRFHREAQAATSLAHPNIVNIYDVGEEENLYYIVMEFVDGETLKQKIQHDGPLPLEQAIALMEQILSAIGHAHLNHIVHRDIKPHNILLTTEGEVKVTDFGIARAASAATITHTNSVMGSVHYLSPEQARGGFVTAQSDIYSLGVVLYEMITGSLPYTGDSAVTIALKHLQEPLPRPSEHRPGLPQSLENIILKATVKDPGMRYGNISEMHEDLKTSLHPERRNEPPFELPGDEDVTKAVPIIKEGYPTDNDETKIAENNNNITSPTDSKGEKDDKAKTPKKKRRWLWVLLFLLLFFTAAIIFAFTALPNMLRVADTEVPDVVEMEESEAIEEIEAAELIPEVERSFDDDVEVDHVISQDPSGGKSVKVDSTVTLYVSDGMKEEEMPELIGLSREQAEEALSDYENIEFTASETADIPPGRIMDQSPEQGESVIPSETTVYLTYSVEQEFQLENLEGASKDAVENYLRNNQLNGNFEERHSDVVREGRVIEHSPGPYNNVTAGETVTFVISIGPDEEPEENTVEETEEEKKVEQVEAVIPVEVEEEEEASFDILIEYEDATTEEQPAVFIEETISETKTYRIPLEVTPEKPGSYTLYVNGEEVQSNRYNYGE